MEEISYRGQINRHQNIKHCTKGNAISPLIDSPDSTNKLQLEIFILQINPPLPPPLIYLLSKSERISIKRTHRCVERVCRSRPRYKPPRIDSIERPVSRNVSIQTSLDIGLLSLSFPLSATVNHSTTRFSSPFPTHQTFTFFFSLSFNYTQSSILRPDLLTQIVNDKSLALHQKKKKKNK